MMGVLRRECTQKHPLRPQNGAAPMETLCSAPSPAFLQSGLQGVARARKG